MQVDLSYDDKQFLTKALNEAVSPLITKLDALIVKVDGVVKKLEELAVKGAE
jgi:hypothetical protein